MQRINRESIYETLQIAGKRGLHIDILTLHLLNKFSELFDPNPLVKEKVKIKVNRILLSDVNKKKGSIFARVINPKTQKNYKGRYRVKIRR